MSRNMQVAGQRGKQCKQNSGLGAPARPDLNKRKQSFVAAVNQCLLGQFSLPVAPESTQETVPPVTGQEEMQAQYFTVCRWRSGTSQRGGEVKATGRSQGRILSFSLWRKLLSYLKMGKVFCFCIAMSNCQQPCCYLNLLFPLSQKRKYMILNSEYQIHRLYFCSKPNSQWCDCANHQEDPICLPVTMPMQNDLVTSEHAP